MPKRGEITVTISPDGRAVDIDADNFIGSACTDYMSDVMKALGNVGEINKKADFFKTNKSGVTVGN